MPFKTFTAPVMPILPSSASKLLLVCVVASSIGACDVTEPARPQAPTLTEFVSTRVKAPKLETTVPRHPAVAVHIVYREYIHLHPGITQLDPDDRGYQKYMEKRLRQLYPKSGGYDGMLADAGRAIKAHRAAWSKYERALAGGTVGTMACTEGMITDPESGEPCTGPGGPGGAGPDTGPTYDTDVDASWSGNDEHPVPPDSWIPTVQSETDSLQLAPEEVASLTYYESLAAQVDARDDQLRPMGSTTSRDDLIRAAAVGRNTTGPVAQNVVYGVIGGTVLAYVGWHAYRAATAGERAEKLSTRYFGHLNQQDTRRDAYRHIFLSMQLRRYLGSPTAKAITDHREGSIPNAASSTWMDYHNNDVGREHKYHRFRGHWLWDRNDSSEWSQKIFYYVNSDANGEFISEWLTEPTVSAAQTREATVDNGKYIYFSVAP